MRIEALNQFNIIKQGDTVSEFKLKLLDYYDEPIDLTDKTVIVIIANNKEKILEKIPVIDPLEIGVISFSFAPEDITGFGGMRLEVNVIYDDGEKYVIPSRGYYEFVITQNLKLFEKEVSE